MGLDQYVYRISQADFAKGHSVLSVGSDEASHDHVDVGPIFNKLSKDGVIQIDHFHYWRKHPNLHGWFEQLYMEKGGQDPSFNCCWVEISLSDLDQLEEVVKANSLPETEGFFFGESDGSEKEGDLQFIAMARESLNQGDRLFYSSWW